METPTVKPVLPSICAAIMLLTASAALPAKAVELVGVNIAGGEFNSKKKPGVFFKDYVYPDSKTVDHFIDQGMNTIRFPFLWERLQRALHAPLDPGELARIDTVVRHATGRGAHVVLDVHNYATYNAKPIGGDAVPTAAFASFWGQLAAHYKDNARVVFGLMNEPKGIRADEWAASAQAAIDAIRASGARNLILVPGTAWTGAHSWLKPFQGISNAEAMAKIKDPLTGRMAFEVHQYLDRGFAGMDPACQNETVGANQLKAFTEWLRKTGARGFLGEFGGGTSPTCLKALDLMLAHIDQNADVWMGWTYWAAGAWWGPYAFSVQPATAETKPQMEILLKHVGRTHGQPAR